LIYLPINNIITKAICVFIAIKLLFFAFNNYNEYY